MPFPADRPRRLRRTSILRSMVRETHLSPYDFVYPIFVREGISEPVPITSMPGQRHETCDSLIPIIENLLKYGCRGVLLFGISDKKDESGSYAWNDEGIVQQAIQKIRSHYGEECAIMTDCCLDEYTSHGHCGVVDHEGNVDNDKTLPLYGRIAVSHAQAGADIIAPSGMMDGQVRAIRSALDKSGYIQTGIMSYSVKYASVFYGPFRTAADSAPKNGDRKGYQMDIGNQREAMHEALLDCEEGADIIMVKPALSSLDILAQLRPKILCPLAAYSVSGEYAMLKAGAQQGAFDERSAVLEILTAIKRAGADIIITYHAQSAAQWLSQGE